MSARVGATSPAAACLCLRRLCGVAGLCNQGDKNRQSEHPHIMPQDFRACNPPRARGAIQRPAVDSSRNPRHHWIGLGASARSTRRTAASTAGTCPSARRAGLLFSPGSVTTSKRCSAPGSFRYFQLPTRARVTARWCARRACGRRASSHRCRHGSQVVAVERICGVRRRAARGQRSSPSSPS